MANSSIACPRCHTPLADEDLNSAAPLPCPGCRTPTQVAVFPAFYKPSSLGPAAAVVVGEGEASCFYHPGRQAVRPCDGCGRFLCALCDVELGREHLCPTCLDTGQRKGKLTALETRRTIYDDAAVAVAVVPLLMWPMTLLTAPLAIGLAVYGWNKPGSLVPRTRVRFYLAILLAAAQLAGWALVLSQVLPRLGSSVAR